MKVTHNNTQSSKRTLDLRLKQYKGISIEFDLSRYRTAISDIRNNSLNRLSDNAITDRAINIAKSINDTASIDAALPEVFALSIEASRRTIGLDAYDEQLIAAIAMHESKLVQMQTGEGKTLAAAFTAALEGMSGNGIHVLTANEYLAKRDSEWMEPLYSLLGLSVAYVHEHMRDSEKRAAYNADVTYLTAKQAGFDFLYDNTQYDLTRRLQRPYSMCIVDEADFIMIDEARIPLVIAKETDTPRQDPVRANRIASELIEDTHFTIDRHGRTCVLTLEGQNETERVFECGGMHDEISAPYYAAVNVALHARHLLIKDEDYIVRNKRIELVDEFTGRVVDKRKWPYGIQTAIEVKERLLPQKEGSVCGSITVQHFIEQYPKVAAMTATAVSAAEEFSTFYHLSTVVIPPHKTEQMIRKDDRVFSTKDAKLNALIREISHVHSTGRPVLIGTRSVRESIELSERLIHADVPHRVLNAENDAEEAPIIANAGIPEAVTISTNMAGRGTDIHLGGPNGDHHDEVADLGGLYVIGTNRHESARIDNQLLGRSARQGDPGSGLFYVSLDDPLISQYAITEFIPEEYLISESSDDQSILDTRVTKEIDRAQEIIEGQHFEMRRTLRKYTEIIEKQRSLICDLRMDALANRLLPDSLIEMCRATFDELDDRAAVDLEEILSLLFIRELDEFWMDHLQWVDVTREGIHLRRLGKRNPLLDFLTDATNAFDAGLENSISRTAESFKNVTAVAEELDRLKETLLKPSSTWTYMISDNPFASFRLSILGVGAGAEAAGAVVSAVAAPFILIYALYRSIVKLCSFFFNRKSRPDR